MLQWQQSLSSSKSRIHWAGVGKRIIQGEPGNELILVLDAGNSKSPETEWPTFWLVGYWRLVL